MAMRDAADIIETDVLNTIDPIATTLEKVAALHIPKTQEQLPSTSGKSGGENGHDNAKKNADVLSDFRSNIVMPALQQALNLGNKASPSTPGMGQGSSGHRQGQ